MDFFDLFDLGDKTDSMLDPQSALSAWKDFIILTISLSFKILCLLVRTPSSSTNDFLPIDMVSSVSKLAEVTNLYWMMLQK